MRPHPLVGWGVGVVLGVPLAFFFAFAPLFADGPRTGPERWFSFGLSFGAYAVVTWGALRAGRRWLRDPVRLLLAGGVLTPAAALIGWYWSREPGLGYLPVAYMLLAVAAACGAFLIEQRQAARATRSSGPPTA